MVCDQRFQAFRVRVPDLELPYWGGNEEHIFEMSKVVFTSRHQFCDASDAYRTMVNVSKRLMVRPNG